MPDATHETPWTTVDIVDQFQRFVRKPELEADATWVPATAVEALRAEVATLNRREREVARLKLDHEQEVATLRAELEEADSLLKKVVIAFDADKVDELIDLVRQLRKRAGFVLRPTDD